MTCTEAANPLRPMGEMAATDTELFIGQPVNWYGPGVVLRA